MKIGVFGIKSTHFDAFFDSLQRLYPDGEHKITGFWGYDNMEKGAEWDMLTSYKTPEELIDASDALMITFRDGTQHYQFAKMVLEAEKPLFVDKPFTCDTKEALELLALSKKHNTPLTGGSSLTFTDIAKKIKASIPKAGHYDFSYQANPFEVYGGWYFYGSHSTDLCTFLFGSGWQEVSATVEGASVTAEIKYPAFSVTLKTTPERKDPTVTIDKEYIITGESSFDAGIRHFAAVAEGKEDGVPERLVSSVELAKAILKSASTKEPVQNSLIK